MIKKLFDNERSFKDSCKIVDNIINICDEVIPSEISNLFDKMMEELFKYDSSLNTLCVEEINFVSFLKTFDILKQDKNLLNNKEVKYNKMCLEIIDAMKSKDYCNFLNLLVNDADTFDMVAPVKKEIELEIEKLKVIDSQIANYINVGNYNGIYNLALDANDLEEKIDTFFQQFNDSKYSDFLKGILGKNYYYLISDILDAECFFEQVSQDRKKFKLDSAKKNAEYLDKSINMERAVSNVDGCILELGKYFEQFNLIGGENRLDNLKICYRHFKKIDEISELNEIEKEQLKKWLPIYLNLRIACYKEIGRMTSRVVDIHKENGVALTFNDMSKIENKSVYYDEEFGVSFAILKSLFNYNNLSMPNLIDFVRGKENLLFSLIFSKKNLNIESSCLAMGMIVDYFKYDNIPKERLIVGINRNIENKSLKDANICLNKVLVDNSKRKI